MAPRELTEDQRYVLRNLVERHADLRGQAIFALGYWAGLRVSDVSWQLMEDTHIEGQHAVPQDYATHNADLQ